MLQQFLLCQKVIFQNWCFKHILLSIYNRIGHKLLQHYLSPLQNWSTRYFDIKPTICYLRIDPDLHSPIAAFWSEYVPFYTFDIRKPDQKHAFSSVNSMCITLIFLLKFSDIFNFLCVCKTRFWKTVKNETINKV